MNKKHKKYKKKARHQRLMILHNKKRRAQIPREAKERSKRLEAEGKKLLKAMGL